MSPILTRPVREQLEHDRVIRQLQARYKRKNEVIINPGNEQNQSVTVGELVVYPDLLLFDEEGRRLVATVEVETGESVNSIEARAEWGVYSKLKAPLYLFVPPSSVDAVKRICAEYQIIVAELWTYTTAFDQIRFAMVHRAPDAPTGKVAIKIAKPAPKVSVPEPKPVPPPEPSRVAKPKPVVKAAPAKATPKAKPKPRAKAKPAAKKAKPATLRQAQGRPEPSRGTKTKPKAKKGAKTRR